MDTYRPPDSFASGQTQHGRMPEDGRHPAPSESFHRLGQLFSELKEYISYMLSARADGVKASIRKIGLYAALGAIGAVAAVTAIAMSVVLLLLGAAGGIGAALGGQTWIGGLIIGAAVLALIGGGAYLFVARMLKSSRSRTVKKYEQRQTRQRGQFGRDVEDAAAAKTQ